MKCTLAKGFIRLSGDPSGKRPGAIVRYSRTFSGTRAFLSSGFGGARNCGVERESARRCTKSLHRSDLPRSYVQCGMEECPSPLTIRCTLCRQFVKPKACLFSHESWFSGWWSPVSWFPDRLSVGCILMARLLLRGLQPRLQPTPWDAALWSQQCAANEALIWGP